MYRIVYISGLVVSLHPQYITSSDAEGKSLDLDYGLELGLRAPTEDSD